MTKKYTQRKVNTVKKGNVTIRKTTTITKTIKRK